MNELINLDNQNNSQIIKQIKRKNVLPPCLVDKQGFDYRIRMMLREERWKKGISQAEAAQLAGITQSQLSRFENDDSNPTMRFIQRIAEALGVKISIKCLNPKGDGYWW